ncbi:hypothetical protein [Halobacteriovorax marinus]|uniref:hypothetical protein n=1 Tax=Halobacteriovorax marinus TaxID=97084 RepID=UPI003A908484
MKNLLMTLLLLSSTSFAYHCESEIEFLDTIQIQQGHWSQTDTCYISISSRKTYNLEYRNFLFTSRGKIQVFNSFGPGPSSTHTGAREFHLFPRNGIISYNILEHSVVLKMANGREIIFDKETAEPIELRGGEFSLDPNLSPNNNGGFEIESYPTLILDSGFKLGMSPTWYLNRYSTFRDAMGQTCRVRNSELFDKKSDEIFWIHENDRELYKYLQKRCPSLTLK